MSYQEDFRRALIEWRYLNGYNQKLLIPAISLFIQKTFESLKNVAYDYQRKYNVMLYNPLYKDDSLYFQKKNLFIKNERVTIEAMLELRSSCERLTELLNKLNQIYFTKNVKTCQDNTERIFNLVELLTRYYKPSLGCGLTLTDNKKTQFSIGTYNLKIFV